MTTYPQHDVYVEDEDGALSEMPFNVAHALVRLGWHTAWSAALRAEEVRQDHKKLGKEAKEAWQALALPWASGPRGGREGGEFVSQVQNLAKSAADHCVAMRIYKEDSGKSTAKLHEPAKEAYSQFETATRHVANTVAAKREEQEEEEEEKEDDAEEDEEEGEDEEDEEEDEEDEEALFGKDYPGSSDDPIEDMRGILGVLHDLFAYKEPLRGVRLCLASEENLPSALESIAKLPGAFGEPGLNAVRLALPDWSGCSEALDSAAGDLLLKAEGLGLQVVLELPAVSGKAYEEWLQKVAAASQSLKCVVGVAMPRVAPDRSKGLLAALRQGGLGQDRCACFLQLPTGDVEADQEELYQSSCSAEAQELPVWLADGHTMLEAAADPGKDIPAEEWPVTAQVLLDAASMLSEELDGLHLVSSWSLAKLGSCKLSDVNETELYREFAQRMLAAVQATPCGFFFDSWAPPSGENAEQRSLEVCCQRGWVDLASEVQIMYPHGSGHTVSLVYLHGFTCDGYSYLAEPHYFYRPKPKQAKKKKASKAKKQEGDDDEDFEELEPFPGLKVVLPTAPRRPITCYKGEMQHAWHDYITDHEGEREDELSAEDLQQTTERVHKMLDAEAALVGARNVYLGGASQGCGTALHIGLTYPGELGGIVGTMGHLLSCTPISREWLSKKIPVYTFNGLDDELMRWDVWVKATYERLAAAGAEVKMVVDEGVDHGEEEDKWIRRFLTDVLKSTAGKKPKKKAK
ncbi:unnamed protein product [Symbiodinium sp. KB8]|nr:unnamed protein product [Symbiodinium sp. KB8]